MIIDFFQFGCHFRFHCLQLLEDLFRTGKSIIGNRVGQTDGCLFRQACILAIQIDLMGNPFLFQGLPFFQDGPTKNIWMLGGHLIDILHCPIP